MVSGKFNVIVLINDKRAVLYFEYFKNFFTGKVYKGEIVGTGEEPLLVAIKTLKENASAKTTADFRREVSRH